MKKSFNKTSREHWGVKVGDEFELSVPHTIPGQQPIPIGTKVIVEGISHFPTMYIVSDGQNQFSVAVHSVKKIR